MIKIAFFDIDGTLLKMGCKEPSENTVLALRQLRQRGTLLCMATGRSYPSIPHFKNITFDIFITFNGSYVKNTEQVIFTNPLDPRDVEIIVQNLKHMHRSFAISNDTLLAAYGTEGDEAWQAVFGGEKMAMADDVSRLCQNDIYQIMCLCNEEEYAQILQGTANTRITAWCDKAADIIPLHSGKGRAVKAVLEHYGFTEAEAIAFGDGLNDIEMLEAVGTGVAMGNAKESVKAAADTVCAAVEEDGVYWFCVENGLIGGV